MNINKILRFSSMFLSLAKSSGEKLPKNSDDKTVVLKNIESLETYDARKKYAEKNFKRLSSGSSRIVFKTKDDTVIKLAKNDKGIAQNKAESNPKIKSKYVNKVLKNAKNYSWIEVPFLEKMDLDKFKEYTDLDFEEFGEAIRYSLKSVSGNSDKETPENFEEIKKNKFFKEITELGKKFDLMPGDLAKKSSWGYRNGCPVLVDVGLTKKIFEEFYES